MKEYARITIDDVKRSDEAAALINMQSRYLETLGYTEHGVRHVGYVSKTTANILRETGADERTVELGEIAGWLHDVGNSLSRTYHGLTGGALAYGMLVRIGMDPTEAAHVANAISNHEEETGVAGDALSSAQKEYALCESRAMSARAEYESCYDWFLKNQAGMLAAGLKPGSPCPVCGSL